MAFSRKTAAAAAALMVGTSTVSAADKIKKENAGLELVDISMERIQVIGKATNRKDVIGSATRLNREDLEIFQYQDINRALRLVPGVNIQEEDGYGLRPNIGLRGTGVERSAKITLMEDGVLIAPAPYASPSAYYFPTAGRMEAIEVRKGSAAIKFGPRSVGGAINLVSRSIPEEFGGFANISIGEDGLRTLHGAAGGTDENMAAVVEIFDSNNDGFKNLRNGGDTGYDIEDYLAKVRFFTDENASVQQALEVKLSITNGDSNETYLGLTDADFAADPYQRYVASELDKIETEHEQIQVTHEMAFDNGVEIVTTAYRNKFERDWFKFHDLQNTIGDGCGKGQFVLDNPVACATELSWLKGESDSAEGAIRVRHNARSYVSKGVQSLVAIPIVLDDMSHDIEISLRYHEDYEDRLQYNEQYTVVNGGLAFSSETDLGSAGNRIVSADAWAFFVQDTIKFGKWTLTPGARFESIDLDRSDWAGDDPTREGAENARETTRINTFVPGMGISYELNENLTLMGGVFKGFNPPGAGNPDAQEEKSLNFEIGVIYDDNGAYFEGMAFYSDYANILGTCTAAVGCSDAEIGDQFNGGEANIKGLELVAGYTTELAGDWQLPFYVNYTYTDAEFSTNFENSFWGDVSAGDDFPYLSKHQLTMSAGMSNDAFNLVLQANYVSASRVEAGTGIIAAADRIDSRMVFDLATQYQITDAITVFATVDNLFNKIYSVARRPIGLLPGKPRTWISGVKFAF